MTYTILEQSMGAITVPARSSESCLHESQANFFIF